MYKHIYQKVFLHLNLFGFVVSILVGFYDVVFGTLFDLIHTILEIIEMGLDKLIESIFHTNLQQTQIIVFYIMLVMGGAVIYAAWKASVMACHGVCQYLMDEWTEFKNAVIKDWQEMTVVNRIIVISGFLLMNYLASFFLF